MDNEPHHEDFQGVLDLGVPEPITDAVQKAVTATKAVLKDRIDGYATAFDGKSYRPTTQEVLEIARREGAKALAPIRESGGLTINYWFTLFFGPDLGPLATQMRALESLYIRWQKDHTLAEELQAFLDTMFEHILGAVAEIILADCRDDNLV